MGAAVGEFGRQRGRLEGRLAALRLPGIRALMRDFISETTFSSSRAAACFSRAGVGDALGELGLNDAGDDRLHRGRAEDLLGLPLELRLGQADRHDRRHAGEHVVLLDLVAADLEPAGVELELLAEDLEQGLLEAGDVGAALGVVMMLTKDCIRVS